jgi:BirA family biotin operon repressor/biotin-[acetyl-CoA-carboxylase] ligase
MDLPLAHHRLAASLAGQPIGHEIAFFDETSSTNDDARRLAESEHPEGVVVFADSQTHGRGRRGTEWFSPPRKNLLLSVLLRPSFPPENWPRLTHMAALALCECIERLLPLEPQVKWPNDIYLGEKKVAGVLLESRVPAGQAGYAILGIGLNINLGESDLPASLRGMTTSLRIERGGLPVAREPIAIELLRALNRGYRHCGHNFAAILEGVKKRSLLLGKQVRAHVGDRIWTGEACDYSTTGGLVLRLHDGSLHALSSADLIRVV